MATVEGTPAAFRTCLTCTHRSSAPVERQAQGQALYDCRAVNKSPRVVLWGGAVPWLSVRLDFGCILWKRRRRITSRCIPD